jgi:hypothetical protein
MLVKHYHLLQLCFIKIYLLPMIVTNSHVRWNRVEILIQSYFQGYLKCIEIHLYNTHILIKYI